MGVITADILTRLLDGHGAALLLYARQRCDVPEDILQDAVLRLVEQPVMPENVVAWMFQVVRNLALNAARSAQRRSRREARASGLREPWFVQSPEDRLDATAATEALSGLPVEQREVIIARLWGGLSFEEIARVTGASKSSLHRWYHQGLTRLRESLEPHGTKTKLAR